MSVGIIVGVGVGVTAWAQAVRQIANKINRFMVGGTRLAPYFFTIDCHSICFCHLRHPNRLPIFIIRTYPNNSF